MIRISILFVCRLFRSLKEITFSNKVTFFVGENGTGKSTLCEAIAYNAGFGLEGGSRNITFHTSEEHYGTRLLSECLTLSWRKKPRNGYFFRAETFFNVANYIDLHRPNQKTVDVCTIPTL